MRKIITLSAVGFALALAAPVLAQDEPNLFISPCGEPFTALPSEPYPIVKWFKGADSNGDGKLDIDEMRADAQRFFNVLDRDHNGYLDSYEVNFYEYRIAPQILRGTSSLEGGIIRVVLRDQRGMEPIVPGGDTSSDVGAPRLKLDPNQGAAPYSLLREPEPVRSADRNFDYRITLSEFLDHSDRHFRALDVKNQGYLTLADLPKTEAEKQAKAHR